MERLQKIIANAGLTSRRHAEEWIREGRVTVNGTVVRTLGYQADPGLDKIKVDGRIVLQKQGYVYFSFHKPAGLITSMRDPEGRPCLGDRLETLARGQRLYPVGRLDYNSSGLLLLTNHGELAFRLTHPRFEVKKAYAVKISGVPLDRDLQRVRKGVRLKEGVSARASVRVTRKLKSKAWLEIEIREGRYREIRRIFEALGYSVEKLVRIRFGPIRLGALPVGRFQPLSQGEVIALKRAAGLSAKESA